MILKNDSYDVRHKNKSMLVNAMVIAFILFIQYTGRFGFGITSQGQKLTASLRNSKLMAFESFPSLLIYFVFFIW
jgi:uncharacterized membrane protein